MDILRFVNSKDIREYLKKTDYEFNTLEAAFLIYFRKGMTLKERHDAYNELIDTMPDMSPKDNLAHCGWQRYEDSIHACLKKHMDNENQLIEEYMKAEKGAVYIEMYDADNRRIDRNWFPYDTLFTDKNEAEEYIKEYTKDDDGELKRYGIILKTDNPGRSYMVNKNREGEILSIDANPYPEENLGWQIEDMWFGFPTPFKKGDILINPTRPGTDSYAGGPFVFRETSADMYRESGKAGYDYTDMTAYGTFIAKDGSICGELTHDYMSLEYYPKEKLTGEKRILIALSNFKKGKISLALLMQAYRTICLEEMAKEMRPKQYTDERMLLAGLKEETK